MKIISRPRGAGKTTELIKISAQTGKYIMVINHQRACEVVEQAEKLGYNIPFPITPQEELASHCAREGILVDDLDRIFLAMIGKPVAAATITEGIEVNDNIEKSFSRKFKID